MTLYCAITCCDLSGNTQLETSASPLASKLSLCIPDQPQ